MNGIDLIWPMMGAASLMLGLIHLTVWVRQRNEVAHLIFSIAALSVVALALCELLVMQADTPDQYASVLRWAHPAIAVLVVSLVAFVQVQFRLENSWLGTTACALRVGSLVPNFTTGVNLNFERITALEHIEILGHESVATPVGDPNPWMIMGQLSNLFLLLFLLRSIVTVWRRHDFHERRRALLVCGSIAIFVAFSSAWAAIVVLGWVSGPMTVNVSFFGIVLVMSYELGGEVLRAAQLARSLTKSESDLRDSEKKMTLAANAAGLGLWNWDLESDDFWFTSQGSDLLGFPSTDERIGREHIINRIHVDDLEMMRKTRDAAINSTGVFLCEFRLLPPSGGTRWLTVNGEVKYSPDGRALCLHGVIYDITERRQAEERFRLVVESAQAVMIMADSHGNIALVNLQAEKVFGYSREELLGQSVDMLLPDNAGVSHARKRASYMKNPSTRAMGVASDVFGRRKDGSLVPLEIGLTPLWISGEMFVLASIADIGERLRSEQEIALQRDEVAHLARVAILGEISGSLAHELNQPLTSILSNAQAALRFLEHSPPNIDEVRDSLTQIVDSDFLSKNVSAVLDLDSGLPAIQGDRVQLQQVLLNLIMNGCDAMKDTPVGRVLRITTRSSDDTSVTVSVHDQGHGIPTGDLERIFMPFVTTKPEGIGLGLAICGTIARTHRGKLWATNNQGQGATFHFQLPVDAP